MIPLAEEWQRNRPSRVRFDIKPAPQARQGRQTTSRWASTEVNLPVREELGYEDVEQHVFLSSYCALEALIGLQLVFGFRRSFDYTTWLLHEEVMPIVLLARLPVLEEPLGQRAPRLSYIKFFHTLISFVISDYFEWPPCTDFSLQDIASYIVMDYHAIASVDAGTLPLCATRWLLSCTNTPSSHLHFDVQESVSEWSTRLDSQWRINCW